MAQDGSPNRPAFVEAMLKPCFYSHQPGSVELRETHISWVFIAGPLVYKVKKPLRLPFLDYGTLERRRELCFEEVRLNEPFAPGVYLRVVGIGERDGKWGLVGGDHPEAVEYAVEMRRIDEGRSLDALARRGELSAGQVQAVAERIAELHAAASVISGSAATETLFEALEENMETMRERCAEMLDRERVRSAANFTRCFERARRGVLEAREARGLVRDCHGDLRAEHAIVGDDGSVLIFDCIEFNASLRQIDVGADVAFLVMDLISLGREEDAGLLLEGYRRSGGDPGDEALAAFFASYRAWVRAKVACLRALELPAPSEERRRAEQEGQTRMALGHRLAWHARRPLALIICGVSGTGKTALAAELAAISGWRQISSDRTRKELLGIAPTDRAGPEAYGPGASSRTYARLGHLAGEELERSGGVIVDATFHLRSERELFGASLPTGARRLFVYCRAPTETLLERIRNRAGDPRRISDADEDVLRNQLARLEPLEEVPAEKRITLETSLPLRTLASRAEALVDERIWAVPKDQ